MWNFKHKDAYLACVADLMEDTGVQSMRLLPQHAKGVSCYHHSVLVSYTSFLLCRLFGLDFRAAARGGLLHDLYLYNPKDRTAHPGNQCFDHPKFALRNAETLCGRLTPKEQNIIISHMWPLARRMPRCREAFVVNLSDKLCATAEVTHIWRRLALRRILLA